MCWKPLKSRFRVPIRYSSGPGGSSSFPPTLVSGGSIHIWLVMKPDATAVQNNQRPCLEEDTQLYVVSDFQTRSLQTMIALCYGSRYTRQICKVTDVCSARTPAANLKATSQQASKAARYDRQFLFSYGTFPNAGIAVTVDNTLHLHAVGETVDLLPQYFLPNELTLYEIFFQATGSDGIQFGIQSVLGGSARNSDGWTAAYLDGAGFVIGWPGVLLSVACLHHTHSCEFRQYCCFCRSVHRRKS